MFPGGRVEHENCAFEPLDGAVLEVSVGDVAPSEVNEERLAGVMDPAMLDHVMNIVPGQVALREALRCVEGEGRNLEGPHGDDLSRNRPFTTVRTLWTFLCAGQDRSHSQIYPEDQ